MRSLMTKIENNTSKQEKLFQIKIKTKQKDNWDVLPCDGLYKVSLPLDKITYSHCKTAYWQCPIKNCLMKLI